MTIEKLKEMLEIKEREIFTLDMKDRWDSNDFSLMNTLMAERDCLKEEIEKMKNFINSN